MGCFHMGVYVCKRLSRWIGALFSMSKRAIFSNEYFTHTEKILRYGSERLPGWFVHFLANFGNVKKIKNRVQKSAPLGGLKLFGHCPHGKNTFQKGASLRDKKVHLPSWLKRRSLTLSCQCNSNGTTNHRGRRSLN